MSIARRLDGLRFFTGSDIKPIIAVEGFNLGGIAGTFNISLAPGADPIFTPGVSTVDVIVDDDGVPTSLVQAYVPASAIGPVRDTLMPDDPGADLPVYYEFRLASLPGDIGTAGPVTLFYGSGSIKASI